MQASISARFWDFVEDWNCKYYLLVGGYGSGKSYHSALKIILKLLTENRTCLVVRNVFETIRASCYELFSQICDALNLEKFVTCLKSPLEIHFFNGSKIIFRGLDNPAKLKSIHNVSLIWVEECAEIEYAAFKELIGRLRHPSLKLFMILSTNPVSKSNWVYKHFFQNVSDVELYRQKTLIEGETYYHHSTALDNKFLPESYLSTLENIKTYDLDLYRVAYLGEFGANGVKVLPQFEVADHTSIMERISNIPARYFFNGLDFGFEVSYNALARVAVDDTNKILYLYDEYYKNHELDIELAKNLRRILGGELVKCDSAEPKAIETLRRYGVNATAAKKWNEGTARARLANTKKIKSFTKIICSDACQNSIRELHDLTYKKDKNDETIYDEFNIDSHILSAIWYALDSYHFANLKQFSRKDLFGY